jgi:alpha-galactosidase
MTVADDGRSAIAAHYQILSRPNPGPQRLRLRGLDAAASYRVSVWPSVGDSDGVATGPAILGGDELMAAGLVLESSRESAEGGDFRARLYVLEAV